MGKYVQVYDDILAKLDNVADLNTAAKRLAAEEVLGYAPTAAEVRTAKEYREIMRAYKNADGSWNANNIRDSIGDTNQIIPARVTANRRPKPVVEEIPEEPVREHEVVRFNKVAYVEHLEHQGDVVEVASDWSSEAARRAALQRNSGFRTVQSDAYRIRHATNSAVEVRFTPHDSSAAQTYQARGDFRLVFNRANPTAKDFEDARQLLEDFGVSFSQTGQTFEEMQLLWAWKQARATGLDISPATRQLFSNIPESLSVSERLERIQSAFDKAATSLGNPRLRWDSLTRSMDDADYMPVFREGDGKGFPQWVRRDVTTEGFESAGVHGAFSSITGEGGEGVFRSMASNQNLAMVATAHRARNGTNWWAGMSPAQDFNTGGANYVFTRLNVRSDTARAIEDLASGGLSPTRVGIEPGIYYNRRALLYSDNLFYGGDKYGRVDSSDFIQQNMVKTMATENGEQAIRNGMTYSSNEMIVKRSLGIEDIDLWVLSSSGERNKMLAIASENGITEINGRPVEQFFVTQ